MYCWSNLKSVMVHSRLVRDAVNYARIPDKTFLYHTWVKSFEIPRKVSLVSSCQMGGVCLLDMGRKVITQTSNII